jgi:uncharacterized protein
VRSAVSIPPTALLKSAAAATPLTALTLDSFIPRPQTELLILQSTAFCNLDCSYCYLPHRDVRGAMKPATAARAMQRLREDRLLGPELTVVWHAGEPLTVGIPFYRQACALIRAETPASTHVTHSFQTNATLIDDAWCDFFKGENASMGVSVDGPADLHDLHRKTRKGRGSFAAAMKGIERLRARGIPFRAIAVVTADTLQNAERFIEFFEGLGVTELCLNIDEAEGVNSRSSLESRTDDYRRFYGALIDYALRRPVSFPIREFTRSVSAIASAVPKMTIAGRPYPFNPQALPMRIVSVAVDGAFSTFAPELLGQPDLDGFAFGNVWTDSCSEAMATDRFQRVLREIIAGLDECRHTCSHFDWCGGGSPANKLYELRSFSGSETVFCRTAFKIPFDDALERLERGALKTLTGTRGVAGRDA